MGRFEGLNATHKTRRRLALAVLMVSTLIPVFGFAQTATQNQTATPLSQFYRFRTLANRQFAP